MSALTGMDSDGSMHKKGLSLKLSNPRTVLKEAFSSH